MTHKERAAALCQHWEEVTGNTIFRVLLVRIGLENAFQEIEKQATAQEREAIAQKCAIPECAAAIRAR